MLPLGADDPRVIGEFRLHAQLGAGGMGRVYLGSSPGGRAVAVKVVHAHLARDAAFRARFRREVAAAQAVNGAYAAPVVAAGPDDDPPWLATAYVAGPSLQEAVAETGPLPPDAVRKLAAGLAEALHVIHDGGVVHRDLKPANVLLADDGPRVIDFGIARALDGTEVTVAGGVIGTPSFMSPEQAQGQPTGSASDIFSLGSVVYFAATGTGPFGSGNHAVLIYRIVHTEPNLDSLPPEVRDLAAACLAKDPAMRPDPAGLAASLMGALPPENAPPAFWPAPVALLIADYQAQFAARLMAAEPLSPEALTVAVAPAIPSPPVAPAIPSPPVALATAPPPVAPVAPAAPPPIAPAAPPRPATEDAPTSAGVARPGQTEPVLPGMARRRALAALAGAATAGLVVAGWELTRPRPSAAANTAASTAGNPAAQRRASSARPGTKLWSFETNGKVGSVAVADGVAYVGTSQQAVYALDALTGRLLWRHLMDSGKTTSLAVADGVVTAANGYNGVQPAGFIGGVYGLDAGTGKLLWNVDAQGVDGLFATGDVVYAATSVKSITTGGITALSTGTGELLWTFNFPTSVDIQAGVTLADDVVYTTTTLGEIFALSAGTGNVLWRVASPAITFKTGPAVSNGVLFASSAHDTQDNSNPVLYALNARTGHVLWQHPLGAALNTAPVSNGAGLVFADIVRNTTSHSLGAGEMIALNATTGQQLWQVPIAGALYDITPGTGNVVYTGSANGVLGAWQADTGNQLWSYQASGAVNSGLVVNDGIAYFGCTDQRVYAVAV
jgi:outer membrane protein assembly factor BamB